MSLSCFKKLPLDFTRDLVLIRFIAGARILFDAVRYLIHSCKRIRFTILSWSVFNSPLAANIAVFLSKFELSIKPKISDISSNPFYFISASSILLVNLLVLDVA